MLSCIFHQCRQHFFLALFLATPIVNGTSSLHKAVLSPSLVDDMKTLSLGSATNGPTPLVQNVSQYNVPKHKTIDAP